MRPPLYIDFDGSLNRTYDGYPAYPENEDDYEPDETLNDNENDTSEITTSTGDN